MQSPRTANFLHRSLMTAAILLAGTVAIRVIASWHYYADLDSTSGVWTATADPQFAKKLWDDLDQMRFSACVIHYHPAEMGPDWAAENDILRSHLGRYYLKSVYGSDVVYLPKITPTYTSAR